MATSSTLSCTEGVAALAFSVPTASLWLRYVRSWPLMLRRTSPGGKKTQNIPGFFQVTLSCLTASGSKTSVHLFWFVHPGTNSRVAERLSRRLAAPRSCCPALLLRSCPGTRGVPSSQWCVSPYTSHTVTDPGKHHKTQTEMFPFPVHILLYCRDQSLNTVMTLVDGQANSQTHPTPYSVSAGAGQVYGHRAWSRAVIWQEVIKAVQVSGWAWFWRWGWFVESTNQEVDSLSACLQKDTVGVSVLPFIHLGFFWNKPFFM